MTHRAPPERIEVQYWPDTAVRVQRLAKQPWFAFLDSCRFAPGVGRYDIVAWDPVTTLLSDNGVTHVDIGGSRCTSSTDPLALLRAALGPIRDDFDLPFCGGAIGAFSYDLARRWENLPVRAARDIAMPEMAVGIYDRALVVDHQRKRAWFVHHGLVGTELSKALDAIAVPWTLTPVPLAPDFVVMSAVCPEMSFAQYAASFARIKRYLRDGDCYQVNFSQRFSARAMGDPFDAYLRLRRLNAAPFAAFLHLPAAAILSSSPERFIEIRGRAIETRPIKGTHPRASAPEQDAALAAALRNSAKDRAENVMIVDLMRNDLSKSCTIGSVSVPQLCALETFARVHHLVSTVRGELRAEVDALAALRSCFPGGSVTGAPKLRAMQIIEELEATRRGIYCGVIGYLAYDGQMDSNIAIRTLLFQNERLYCWAGGGIVSDSVLADEYQESLDKAAALLSVFADATVQYLGI